MYNLNGLISNDMSFSNRCFSLRFGVIKTNPALIGRIFEKTFKKEDRVYLAGLFPLRLLPISSTPISSTPISSIPTSSTVFIFQKLS